MTQISKDLATNLPTEVGKKNVLNGTFHNVFFFIPSIQEHLLLVFETIFSEKTRKSIPAFIKES